MFTAQEFNENLKKKRMGDFSYNLEKTKEYIVTNKKLVGLVILTICFIIFITYKSMKNGFEHAMIVATSGDLAEKLDKDYEPIEPRNIVI